MRGAQVPLSSIWSGCSAQSPAWDSRTCRVLRGGPCPTSHTRVLCLPLDVGLGGEELWAPRAGHTVANPSWATKVSGTHQGQRTRAQAEAAPAPRAILSVRQGMQLTGAAGRGVGRTPQLRPVLLCCCRSFSSLSQLIAVRRPHPPSNRKSLPGSG